MREVVIVSAVRTPVGSFGGVFQAIPAPKLAALAIREALRRVALDPAAVDEVLMGCVLPAGIGQAPARQAALYAGLPTSVPCTTVNKVCGSGLKTVMLASQAIACGDADVVVAGGMENMDLAPYALPKARSGYRMGDGQIVDLMVHDGLWDPYQGQHMGMFAEKCAEKFGFTREAQDAFALRSYRRAQAAIEAGEFREEIVPVEVARDKGETALVDRDEEPFKLREDKVPKLRPAFKKDGTVTAANASSINDGGAAVVLMAAEKAAALGLQPLARIVGQSSFAQEPEWFTTAPVYAIEKVLNRHGLKAADIDLWEINEAFAVVTMAAIRHFELDEAKVNVFGGAVSIGHPIGCSGARILVTLLHAMKKRSARRGLATLCIGGGEAVALVVERG